MKIKAENAERFVQHCEMLSDLSDAYAGITGFRIGYQIYEKLRRIEAKANRMYVQFCNVGYTDKERDDFDSKITKSVMKLIPKVRYFHLNGDPRGYSLKIDFQQSPAYSDSLRHMHRDFGGYGILAPEF